MRVTISRTDMLAGIGAVRMAAAKDVITKPHLACIRLALRPATPAALDIVATDGHRVHRFRVEGVDADTGGDATETSIHAGALRELTAWLKANDAETITIDFDESTIGDIPFRRVTMRDADPKCDAADADATAYFPAYDKVIPDESARAKDVVPAIAFDAAYVADACKAFTSLRPARDKRPVCVRFAMGADALDVVRITSSVDSRLVVALMPVRL